MYSYRYINRFAQLGYISYTLIIEDLEDPTQPTARLEKTFNMSEDQLDDDVLAKAAQVEIQNLVQWIANNPLQTEDPSQIVIDDSGDGG